MRSDHITLCGRLGAIALLLAVHSTPALAQESANSCDDVTGKTSSIGRYVSIEGDCENATRPTSKSRSSANTSTLTSSDQAKYLQHRTVSACFPNQLNNPDYGGCRDQSENFCPEGSWIRAQTVDTRTPDDDPLYGQPICWTGASRAGDGTPPLSIDEVRTLLVLDPEIRSDNAGRGVRNAETNFYADAQTRHLVTTLNGVEVELRATPVSYHWDYGDGTPARTTTVAGHAQPEFNAPTPTSHVYEDTGRYEVTLTTVYIGEYREAGGDWVLIPGTITLGATPVTADIWKTVTRNVADDCGADPSAWGCTGPIESPDGG